MKSVLFHLIFPAFHLKREKRSCKPSRSQFHNHRIVITESSRASATPVAGLIFLFLSRSESLKSLSELSTFPMPNAALADAIVAAS